MPAQIDQQTFQELETLVNNRQYTEFYTRLHELGSNVAALYIPGPTGQGVFGSYSYNYVSEIMGEEGFQAARPIISEAIANDFIAGVRATRSPDGDYRLLTDIEFLQLEVDTFNTLGPRLEGEGVDASGFDVDAYPGNDLIGFLGLDSDISGEGDYQGVWGALWDGIQALPSSGTIYVQLGDDIVTIPELLDLGGTDFGPPGSMAYRGPDGTLLEQRTGVFTYQGIRYSSQDIFVGPDGVVYLNGTNTPVGSSNALIASALLGIDSRTYNFHDTDVGQVIHLAPEISEHVDLIIGSSETDEFILGENFTTGQWLLFSSGSLFMDQTLPPAADVLDASLVSSDINLHVSFADWDDTNHVVGILTDISDGEALASVVFDGIGDLQLGAGDDVLQLGAMGFLEILNSVNAGAASSFGDVLDMSLFENGSTTVSLPEQQVTLGNSGAALNIAGFENVIGSLDSDTIIGDGPADGASTGSNIISGGDGADIIDSGAGNDLLLSDDLEGTEPQPSTDTLFGGAGDDVLIGDSGDGDTLDGDDGSDLIIDGSGANSLYGGDGSDFIISGGGEDHIYGGAGNDWINAVGNEEGAVVHFGADSGSVYIEQAADGSGETGVAEIRFDVLSTDDVMIQWDGAIVEELSASSGELNGPDYYSYSTQVLSVSGQAYIVVPETGAVINLGGLNGTISATHNFTHDGLPVSTITYDLGLENSHELVFTDATIADGEPLLEFTDHDYNPSQFEGPFGPSSIWGPGGQFTSYWQIGNSSDFVSPYGDARPDQEFTSTFENPFATDLEGLPSSGVTPLHILDAEVLATLTSFSGGGSGSEGGTGGDGGDSSGGGGDGSSGGGIGPVDGTDGNDRIDGNFMDGQSEGVTDVGQVIHAGAGSDVIYDGAGDDTVYGGAGQDRFFSGLGADHYSGGESDRDEVRYQYASAGLTIDMSDAANSTGIAEGDTYDSIERIQGSDFDDVIILTGDTEVSDAREGNDLIIDGDGRNAMRGGAGADVFQFGAGDGHQDQIRDFEVGEDRIDISAWGVSDFDDLVITPRNATSGAIVTYGDESIRLDGLAQSDIDAISASDFILVPEVEPSGTIALSGTEASDIIGLGYIDASGTEYSNAGHTIYAGSGSDTVHDGAGDDVVYGGDGQDRFFAGAGADHYDGGAHHNDEVLYHQSSTGLTIDMTDASNSTGVAAGDTFVGIERIKGTNYDDVIILAGSTAVNDARGGDDLIIDGDGLNTMRGGAGADTFQFTAGDGHQDRIDDFTIGEDIIDVSAWGMSGVDEFEITAHSSGNGVVLTHGDDNIRLLGLTVNDANTMTDSDFVFV